MKTANDCKLCIHKGTGVCGTCFGYDRIERYEAIETPHDVINTPKHYTEGGIEPIDYMRAKMTDEQFGGFLMGNVLKYVSRFKFKNGLEDLKKAQWYLNKLIDLAEGRTNNVMDSN